jgi:hypothetical protein
MKVFNIILLSNGFGFIGVMSIAQVIQNTITNQDTALMVLIPLGIAWGFSVRRIIEKILGYTLQESVSEIVNKNK